MRIIARTLTAALIATGIAVGLTAAATAPYEETIKVDWKTDENSMTDLLDGVKDVGDDATNASK